MSRDREAVEFEDVRVVAVSALALCCVIHGEDVWVPRSQILSDSEITRHAEKGDSGTLVIPEWLAIEKELV